MAEIKVQDHTKQHSGKWYEVIIFCTTDRNEKPDVIAKFISPDDALNFAEMYTKTKTGYLELIVR